MKALATRWLPPLLALVVFFCAAPAAAQVKVVASFTILADMVRNVGGDRVEVASLVGPDADTHVYQPTPGDARAIAGAHLVVVNGLSFEGWLDRLVQASGYRGPIVIAAEGTAVRIMTSHERAHAGHTHDHAHDGGPAPDPHAWQDLAKGQIYVRNIAEGLIRADPANAATYRDNAARYLARLAELDAWVRQQFSSLPADRRKVITSHDAFG
ncbi:MAG TPA: zinc ABC transporter substrate-binding protein, partial [Alphaproteobacteria bacterium]|nr:zinc ABC transporter substrate-binding protein [Alphaproteobacteria bacterium]